MSYNLIERVSLLTRVLIFYFFLGSKLKLWEYQIEFTISFIWVLSADIKDAFEHFWNKMKHPSIDICLPYILKWMKINGKWKVKKWSTYYSVFSIHRQPTLSRMYAEWNYILCFQEIAFFFLAVTSLSIFHLQFNNQTMKDIHK